MQLYFEANTVENDRKVAVLLTVVGARTYETLRSLLAPARPRDKSFDELLGVLKKHFDTKPVVIAERFRFYQRSQKSNESVADFVADLRRLCITCEFVDFLDQVLRERFVCDKRNTEEATDRSRSNHAEGTADSTKHGICGQELQRPERRRYFTY